MRFSPFKTKEYTTLIFILKYLSMYNVLQIIAYIIQIHSNLTMFKKRCDALYLQVKDSK